VEGDEWEGEISYYSQAFLVHLALRFPDDSGWNLQVKRQDGSILTQSSHATPEEAMEAAKQRVRQMVDRADQVP
jgi:hypothetical protein